jgi:cytochrome b6-f complex iron-sulfur subunit
MIEEGGTVAHAEGSFPRRRFFSSLLNYLLTGGVVSLFGTLLYPVLRFIISPEVSEATASSVVAGKLKDFPANVGKVFRFGARPAILIQTSGGELRAFSAVCTHLNCTVQYRPDLEHIWCACHNGHFDLSGKNIAGPPPHPLERYDVAVRGDDVIVTRKV